MRSIYHGGIAALTLLRAMADESNAGSGGGALTIEAAVASLDDDNPDHWTQAGLPKVEVIQQLTGQTEGVNRETIDAFGRSRKVDGADDQQQASAGEQNEPGDLLGSTVKVCWPGEQTFDGEQEAVGLVVKVAEDGTLNVKALAPNGGADQTITGLVSAEDHDQIGDDDPAKNLPWWDYL